MEDFVVIGEQGGTAFIEESVKMIEPITIRYNVPLVLPPVQVRMGLTPIPDEWKRPEPIPSFYWLNRFNTHCGCLMDNSCVGPHQCHQKMWIERPNFWPPSRYRGPHRHVL